MQQERETVTAVHLAQVHRHGKTALDRGILGTVRVGHTVLLIDVFRFTDPETLLFGIGRSGSDTAKHGNIHHLVFGQRETSLQVNLKVTHIANLGVRNNSTTRAVAINTFSIKLIIIDGHRHAQIKVVPDTDSETDIGASTYIVRNRSALLNTVKIRFRNSNPSCIIVREHVITERSVTQEGKYQFGMTKGLGRLGLIHTHEAFLVDRLGMSCKGGSRQSKGQAHSYFSHSNSLIVGSQPNNGNPI